ncbi:MAG: hypothetical protein H6Q54_785, partial [Deltaproteobacteria bacterium]|nr:hypothetical protein [Deltaproteobacteria bacterium]
MYVSVNASTKCIQEAIGGIDQKSGKPMCAYGFSHGHHTNVCCFYGWHLLLEYDLASPVLNKTARLSHNFCNDCMP